MSEKVIFLGMGGTIAGLAASASDNVGYRAAQVNVAQLLAAIPALQGALAGYEMEAEQVAQVDSKDLDFAHWVALAQRASYYLALPQVKGLVITHGTDTLEETAFFLAQVLWPALLASKPVVLTCAMRPASALSPDGPQNLLDAVAVVRAQGACGVVAVCAGVVHAAIHVQKVHPYRLDAFDSGDAGPLGFVEEGTVRWVQSGPRMDADRTAFCMENLAQAVWPRVEIVMNYVGATGSTVRALCVELPGGAAPVRGLVVAGTGNGTVHSDLEAALCEAEAAGVCVVRSTRCARGCLVLAAGSGSAHRVGHGLPPVKARIALMLALLA